MYGTVTQLSYLCGILYFVYSNLNFMFPGERDRVKCWYCNGGLQNWEYEDSPWIEHAKWFPSCQNLQQKRGVKFVYHHLSAFPHLSRPIIARQEGSPLVQDQRQLGINSPVRQPARCLEIIDPRVGVQITLIN